MPVLTPFSLLRRKPDRMKCESREGAGQHLSSLILERDCFPPLTTPPCLSLLHERPDDSCNGNKISCWLLPALLLCMLIFFAGSFFCCLARRNRLGPLACR